MSEERTQYTAGGKVTPDNAGAAMQLVTENYIAQLERTIDGYAMIQGRHAEMIAERDARIAELTDALARKNGALHALDVEVQRQSETIARLEQDNKRLRHLDAMPVDAMRRLVANSEWSGNEDYTAGQYVCDYNDTMKFFRDVDGAA